jgi:alpha-beta hydrolase superfamily lysophospholipase
MSESSAETVVLIHGLWMTPRSWERWVERFEAQGHKALAPSWPGLEKEVEAIREDAYANFNPKAVTKVSRDKHDRAPLLLIGGDEDHISPPAITKATRKVYAKSHSTTDMRQYPGKTHWIAGQPGWEEVADHALEWAIAHHAAPKAMA